MTTYLQYHMLTSFGPSNPNRDDQGRPKQAKIGGTPRLRLSSQSFKRALRESTFFKLDLAGNIGVRTKKQYDRLVERGVKNGIPLAIAEAAANQVAKVFGKIETKNEKTTGTTLAFISPDEMKAADDVFDQIISGQMIKEDDLKTMILRKADGAVDIAMFGRMLADTSEMNRDAAVQVSHAFTTHTMQSETDWFTGMDDLNNDTETGAGHIDEAEFGGGLFYTYICVDCDLLISNLGGAKELAVKAIEALTNALPANTPKGKQNSFAHHPLASYMLVEVGTATPHNLDAAFFEPVRDTPLLTSSIRRLQDTRNAFNLAYGKRVSDEREMIVGSNTVTLKDIITFVGDEMRKV